MMMMRRILWAAHDEIVFYLIYTYDPKKQRQQGLYWPRPEMTES